MPIALPRIHPCLWFDGRAEEAMNFYLGIFERARMTDVLRYGKAGPGPEGAVLTCNFELDGQTFTALNGGPQYKFTPAISLFVSCEDQQEVDRYWDGLLADGGQPVQCGWLTDRFGLSWQVAPRLLLEYLRDPDAARSERVMRAMMRMIKIDIAALREAYEGG